MQKHPSCTDGYNTLCLICNNRRVQEWRKENREKHRQQTDRYYSKNPHKALARDAKRRAAKRNRLPIWADVDQIEQIYKQAAELTAETGIPHEVDHILPLQGKTVSGLHVHNNLQILTQFENRSKGNKLKGTRYAN
jgi:hypothetical protein